MYPVLQLDQQQVTRSARLPGSSYWCHSSPLFEQVRNQKRHLSQSLERPSVRGSKDRGPESRFLYARSSGHHRKCAGQLLLRWSRLERTAWVHQGRVRRSYFSGPRYYSSSVSFADGVLHYHRSAAFLDSLRSTLRLIEDLPVPSIAAVSSVALGGGLELAMATSLRVFARTAVVGLPETRLGIIPGAGGTYRLGRLIGKSHAKDLILTGRRVDADEAFRLGLCNRLVGTTNDTAEVARQQALTEALKLATQICDGGPLGVRAALKAIDAGNEEGENAQYETVIDTDDRNEALLAFKEKRKPAFIGR